MNEDETKAFLVEIDKTLEAFSRLRFIGEPIKIKEENGIMLWRQLISEVPNELIRFKRILLPSTDGVFRSIEYASQEHLIDCGLVTVNADACTNIPWRYFQSSINETPFDLRVKKIVKGLRKQKETKFTIHKKIRKIGFVGFPDILDFGGDWLSAWEIKFVADNFTKVQKEKAKFLTHLGVQYNILNYIEPDRSLREYISVRRNEREKAQLVWPAFWKTDLGKRFNKELILRALKGERKEQWRPVVTRRIGAEDLLLAKSGPNYFIRAIGFYAGEFFSKEGKPAKYSSPVYRAPFWISSNELIELCVYLFRSGSVKWWKVAFCLLPFVSDTSENPLFIEFLRKAREWENTLKTEHLKLPNAEHFKENLSFRITPKQFQINESHVSKLYEYVLELNQRTGLAGRDQKDFHEVFSCVWRICKPKEIVMRDNDSIGYIKNFRP